MGASSDAGFRALPISADRLGVCASALCIVHCAITPILLSYSAVLAHFLPSDEKVHRSLAVAIASIWSFGVIPWLQET